ncbi:hypothetical protein GCM10010489_16970 [Microbacterium saperdae]|nr:hypothetical protein GCM10010489_16970 [Microbacterium saperdae]
MVAAVDDGDFAARFGSTLSNGEAEETRPDDEKIHGTYRIGGFLGVPLGVPGGGERDSRNQYPGEP